MERAAGADVHKVLFVQYNERAGRGGASEQARSPTAGTIHFPVSRPARLICALTNFPFSLFATREQGNPHSRQRGEERQLHDDLPAAASVAFRGGAEQRHAPGRRHHAQCPASGKFGERSTKGQLPDVCFVITGSGVHAALSAALVQSGVQSHRENAEEPPVCHENCH